MKKWILIMVLCLIQLTLGQETPNQGLKLSFSYRFRYELMESTSSLRENVEDATIYTRNRTSLMARYFFNSNMELGLKLTNEFRHYFSPNTRKFEIHEGVLENLYFRWNSLIGGAFDLTIGRQNINLGEGLMISDGTPLDGSRTNYFNALRLDYRFTTASKVTAFVCSQQDQDDYLPRINDRDQPLNDQPEIGYGLYFSTRFKSVDLEPYFIRRDIDDTDLKPVTSSINSLGCRIILPLQEKKITFTGELAYQLGKSDSINASATSYDRKAYGGFLYATLKLPASVPFGDKLTIGGFYLSGDDPETADLEGWDPMYGRFPKWSESFVYTLTKEYGVAYWSNFNSIFATLNLKFSEQVTMILSYHRMGAQYARPTIPYPGGNGTHRGNLVIARVHYKINSVLSGQIVLENLNPGSYYFDDACVSNWGRAELLLQF